MLHFYNKKKLSAYLDGFYPDGRLDRRRSNALGASQCTGGEELSTLLLSVLDRAFKGEL